MNLGLNLSTMQLPHLVDRLADVPAEVSFRGIRPGKSFEQGGFHVRTVSLNHPGGALGYRVQCKGEQIAYLTDTAPFASPGEGVEPSSSRPWSQLRCPAPARVSADSWPRPGCRPSCC